MLSSLRFCPLLLLALSMPAAAQDAPAPEAAPEAATAEAPPAAPTVAPQVLAEPEATIDELVQRALANNPGLPIARQSQEAARQRLGAARSFPSPTLELVPRIVGSREAADTEVIVSQPLDLFGQRRAQARVAQSELRRAQAQSTLAERALVLGVKNAAAELFAAQEAESLGEVQVEVARLFRSAVARRAELGDVPPVQVQRAELEMLRVQNELSNAQAERLARRAGLNQFIGQEPQAPLRVSLPLASALAGLLRAAPTASSASSSAVGFGVAGSNRPAVGNATAGATETASAVTAEPSSSGSAGAASTSGAPESASVPGAASRVGSNLVGLRAQVLPGALVSRPDVLGAEATLEARRAQVQVLRKQRLPAVELQIRRGSFLAGGPSSYALRAVVTVPLFDFGSLKRERRALEAEAGAQAAAVELLRSQVSAQVEQALVRLEQGRQTVERYRSGIVPISIDLLRKTQIGYEQGASTYLEVLEAQRTLRQVQTEYLQAIVGTRTGEAAVESALGSAPGTGTPQLLANPAGPAAPPGIAAPGTVPEGTIPAGVQPLSSPSFAAPATGAPGAATR